MDNKNIQSYIFHVNGMHCDSCVLLIEENLKKAQGITGIKADLHRKIIEISGFFNDPEPLAVAENLTRYIKEFGYTLSLEKINISKNWSDFVYAVPIALILLSGFFYLQKLGVLNLVNIDKVNFGTAFLVGLIASISTCLAIVGGLTLSLSANYSKTGEKWKPQSLFHSGRLIGFFILGGFMGLTGSFLRLNAEASTILSVIVSIVMLILGINLLDIFHFTKRFQITMPKSVSRIFLKSTTSMNTIAPFLIGAGTFFLPCGFTQSMQVYALYSGNFLTGGLIMLSFSLGTLPVLSLISFGFTAINNKNYSVILLKAAGIVVTVLALFTLMNILVANGIINPIF